MRSFVVTAAVAASLAFAAVARADGRGVDEPETDLSWDPQWVPFDTWEYIATGGIIATTFGMRALVKSREEPLWTGGLLIDSPARSSLAFDTRDARTMSDRVSDVTWHTTELFPVFDAVLVVGLLHGEWATAWQLVWISAETLGIVGFVTTMTQLFLGRERPFGPPCDQDPEYDELCGSASETTSFMSGHASMAFAGAALTCTFHDRLPSYGSPAADAIPCAASLVLATTTAVLRTTADRHYVSDVVISGSLGFVAGMLLPRFLHFGFGETRSRGERARQVAFVPYATPTGGGLALEGAL